MPINLKTYTDLLGLDFKEISLHQLRIMDKKSEPTYSIIETCRIDNNAILKLSSLSSRLPPEKPESKIRHFVPAAGASSRYLKAFQKLSIELEKFVNIETIQSTLKELFSENHKPELIPSEWKNLLETKSVTDDEITKARNVFTSPKAAMPVGKKTFAEIKCEEHKTLRSVEGLTFITKHHGTTMFNSLIKDYDSQLDIDFLEQDPNLSTLRFNKDGTPLLDSKGNPTLVPAGHGMLAKLIEKTGQNHRVDGVLIQNIDNVIKNDSSTSDTLDRFVDIYRCGLDLMKSIRNDLKESNLTGAIESATKFANIFDIQNLCISKNSEKIFNEVLTQIFHDPDTKDYKSLKDYYLAFSKPFNILAQVPNTQNNVGGLPVWIHYHGKKTKICIEGPHISLEQSDELKEKQLVTHFNPALVCAEANISSHIYFEDHSELLIVSKKTFEGQDAFYCESVLYELLSNSQIANCIFVEVPRELFNPHKSISGNIQ